MGNASLKKGLRAHTTETKWAAIPCSTSILQFSDFQSNHNPAPLRDSGEVSCRRRSDIHVI